MATIKVRRTLTSNPPAGLTFGELAFVQGITSFYVTNNVGTSVRIGAEVDTNTSLGTSDNKLPTQNAVKTYVDSAVAASGIDQFNQIAVAGQNGLTADSASDILTFAAGSGINITTNSGTDTITIANSGVLSLTGTPNEVEVTGSGTLTVGLPNDVTITNNLTVGGNLTINGTTTTVNSDVTTVDDPMMLLGTSGGVPITVTDGGKDRGIAFTYFDGSAGRTGFFGFDASASRFTYVPVATIAGDIVTSGNAGDAQFKSLYLTTDGTNIGGLTLATLNASRTYTLPDVSGTIITTGDTGTVTSTMIANDTIVNADINASAGIVDTKLATISTADKVSILALNIDGGSDIGAAIADGDLLIIDDGGAGTNRKTDVTRVPTYVFGKVSSDITIASNGVASISAGVIVNDDINASAGIFDTKLATISTADKVSISALNIDGGTDIGTDLADADLIIVDDGNSGNNRKAAMSRVYPYVFSKISGDVTINSSGVAAIGSGVIVNDDISGAAAISDTKLATISTANKVSLSAIDLDGAIETTTIVGTDILFVDDGANGSNRKVTVDNLFGANSTGIIDGGTYV
jgi:hypothetical protein